MNPDDLPTGNLIPPLPAERPDPEPAERPDEDVNEAHRLKLENRQKVIAATLADNARAIKQLQAHSAYLRDEQKTNHRILGAIKGRTLKPKAPEAPPAAKS